MSPFFCFFLRVLHENHTTPSVTKTRKETDELVQCVGYPTHCTRILHPILHPKSSVNTGHFVPWCRKCRRFSKTFFVEEREAVVRKQQNIGLLWAKLRMFCFKSTDVFIKEVRCFCIPERRFHNLNVSLSERRGQTCGLC